MHIFEVGALTAPLTGTLIGLGLVCSASGDGATEFMLRHQMLIKQRTTYLGSAELTRSPSQSSQEIVVWLREEGIPMAVIAEIMGVERKSVYAWLSGGAVKMHNQERLEKIYSLLHENKLTSLRHLYRFWSRSIIEGKSLASLLQETPLDEISIHNALSQLWPLAKKEKHREVVSLSNSSIKSNPFLRESHEVTTSYDS